MSTKGDKVARLLRIEPSERWVRAQVGDEFVVDCRRPLLVWEHEKYPTYFFPRQDVRMDWLEEGVQTRDRTFWNLTVNGQLVERAAYHLPDQPQLEGYITFQRWDARLPQARSRVSTAEARAGELSAALRLDRSPVH
jgi:uncharacterized protein (DUF427 family)